MTSVDIHRPFLQRCLTLAAEQALRPGGGPFAALVVRQGEVIAEAGNQVTGNCDPTAHAEVMAIRAACARLGDHQLRDCIIYSSCEPCPMCLGAIYWARPQAVYYAAGREAAARAGFDDSFIYQQLDLPGPDRSIPFHAVPLEESAAPFTAWQANRHRRDY